MKPNNKKKNKPFLIISLTGVDLLVLCVLGLGTVSTFNSNRENLEIALIFLALATIMYFVASTAARKAKPVSGFTRSLNSFVSGLLFLVAPCIFMYHWQYKSDFESAVLMVFILSGILRIAAFNHFGSLKDAEKFYYTGMPVFWSPVVAAFFYFLSFWVPQKIVNPMITVTLLAFSFLMLFNHDFKFLHKPKAWIK